MAKDYYFEFTEEESAAIDEMVAEIGRIADRCPNTEALLKDSFPEGGPTTGEQTQ